MSEWRGVIPAMVTPLKDEGRSVDHDALRIYCEFLAERGIHGVFCGGTTGEGPLLSVQERKEIAETVVSQLKNRVPVIIQTGCITTDQTLELTNYSKSIGADAAGILLPYYYGYNDELLFSYFLEISKAVPDFPLFIYNIPQCTCNNMSSSLFERLLDNIDSIVGIKNSNADIFQDIEFVKIAKGRCSLFIGNDSLLLAGFSIGANGFVSGNASAFPEPFIDIYNTYMDGDLSKLREKQYFIDMLSKVLANGRDNASFKKALSFRGIRAGNVRSPDKDLSDRESQQLKKNLEELGLL
jgi:dihydrodipicolinate synthase/N-acetylneuraminate lyase